MYSKTLGKVRVMEYPTAVTVLGISLACHLVMTQLMGHRELSIPTRVFSTFNSMVLLHTDLMLPLA
jgi:hypothetical protein